MGIILVALDKTNPDYYIVHLETNEHNKFTYKVNDEQFDDMISKLIIGREIQKQKRLKVNENFKEKMK